MKQKGEVLSLITFKNHLWLKHSNIHLTKALHGVLIKVVSVFFIANTELAFNQSLHKSKVAPWQIRGHTNQSNFYICIQFG